MHSHECAGCPYAGASQPSAHATLHVYGVVVGVTDGDTADVELGELPTLRLAVGEEDSAGVREMVAVGVTLGVLLAVRDFALVGDLDTDGDAPVDSDAVGDGVTAGVSEIVGVTLFDTGVAVAVEV